MGYNIHINIMSETTTIPQDNALQKVNLNFSNTQWIHAMGTNNIAGVLW